MRIKFQHSFFNDSDFKEEEHPRNENGEFTSGSNGKKVSEFLKSQKENKILQSEEIKEAAEEFAESLRKNGFRVDVTHSGSKAGASSYLNLYDPQTGRFMVKQIRFSGHSKGVLGNESVHGILRKEDVEAVEATAKHMRELGPSEHMLSQEQGRSNEQKEAHKQKLFKQLKKAEESGNEEKIKQIKKYLEVIENE